MGGRFALLIGNCVFDDPALARLAAPEEDVISLRQVLEDPAIGGFQAELCLNAGTDPVKDAITRLFADRAPDDVLLLYYTGHGLRDDRGDLYLAVQGTRTARPRGISVGADFIRTEMQGCSARSQVLILDCCHAGAAMRDGAKAAAGAPQLYQTDFDRGGTGRYTLAASSANESAFEGRDGRSVYTRHLVTALRTGAAAPERSEISVADLHAYVARQLADEKLPQGPRLWVDEQTGPLVIARNPNPEEPVPADLLAALRDPDPLRASGAVARLTVILRGPNAARAQKVRTALQKLIDDPAGLSFGIGMEINGALSPTAATGPDRSEELAALEQRAALAEEVQAATQGNVVRLRKELDAATEFHERLKTAANMSQDARQKAERALAWRTRMLGFVGVALVVALGTSAFLGWGLRDVTSQMADVNGQLESATHENGKLTDENAELAEEVERLQQPDPDTAPPYRATSAEVKEAQTLLSGLGLYGGAVDGVSGNGTEAAVRKFQRTNSLLETGTLNLATLATLRANGEPEPSSTGPTPWQGIPNCDFCPEMVVIPAGTFLMGSPDTEPGRSSDEDPQTPVTVASFALAKTEVTFDQWAMCVQGGGCKGNPEPGDSGFGKGDRPVINVSWNDALEYIAWLNEQAEGSPYRLPTEAEWEYAARGGGSDAYPWGPAWDATQANGEGGGPARTVAVASYTANGFGLFDMIGNVWEWTEDCWHDGYVNRPTDARPWLSEAGGDCARRVVRGGSWGLAPADLRSASRVRFEPGYRSINTGFRPARTLTP